MVMTHRAQKEHVETYGKEREFKPEELFQKFVKEYLFWYEKDYGKEYKLVSINNGIFETEQVMRED